ncbi:DUF222 domain-containing protein [Frankia sp. Ag45/Mut15]|uniref:DUF222 domain-containing protein n=1 Tax=Frankia umida TaxID=573489 RepID=A0ABT0JTB9_9ACTN|nr:DUF222 domain-containing protein [Frankia umida]MCK9874793.1 DUF222 domain-containing protein [Frankia umida]
MTDSPSPALDPEQAPLDDVAQALRRWSVRLAKASHIWLTAIAAFDRREGWNDLGVRSCAHWLALHCGLDLRTAREHLATAHALSRLPSLRAASAAGLLSYSKLRAVTRVATPDSEADWLDRALRNTASRLERLVSRRSQQAADPAKLRAARALSFSHSPDGTIRLTATLAPDDAAILIAAIDAAHASLEANSGSEPVGPPADGDFAQAPRGRAQDADALIALAEAFLHHNAPALQDSPHALTVHLTAPDVGDEPAQEESRPPSSDDEQERQERGVDEDEDENEGEVEEPVRPPSLFPPGIAAVLGWGIGLPPAMVSRLACDSMIRALVSDPQRNPLHLGRRRRHPTRRVRDAVYARDQGICQFPGCDHTRWLQIHHCHEWHADRGETNVELLLLICGAHHRAIHDQSLTAHRDHDGTVTVRAPDGQCLRSSPRNVPSPSVVNLDDPVLCDEDGHGLTV